MFQQDGEPAHQAKKTQEWIRTLVREDLPFTRDPAAYAPREEDEYSYVAAAKLHPHGVPAITIWNA